MATGSLRSVVTQGWIDAHVLLVGVLTNTSSRNYSDDGEARPLRAEQSVRLDQARQLSTVERGIAGNVGLAVTRNSYQALLFVL